MLRHLLVIFNKYHNKTNKTHEILIKQGWRENVSEIYIYSITSMARTRMARLPWMIRTLFFSPYKILPIAQENKYLGIFFLFYHGIVCCVYSLESPHRGDSNEYTQHTIIVQKIEKISLNYRYLLPELVP